MLLALVIASVALLGVSVLLAGHRRWVAAAAIAVAVLIVVGAAGFGWLSFAHPAAFLPIRAIVTPDRQYASGGTMIPLPSHTVKTGGCSDTGRWFYSRSPLADVAEFYRTAGATVDLANPSARASIMYKEHLIEAVGISANETQLGIGCRVSTPQREPGVPFKVLLNNHEKGSWKPDNAKTEAFLFLDEAKDLAIYPLAGTSDPVSSPFPPAELGTVDFSRDVALFLTRGEGHHSPHGLEVKDITQTAGVLTVYLEFIDPVRVFLTVNEFRIALVTVPRAALPSRPFQIRFVDQTGKLVRELEVR